MLHDPNDLVLNVKLEVAHTVVPCLGSPWSSLMRAGSPARCPVTVHGGESRQPLAVLVEGAAWEWMQLHPERDASVGLGGPLVGVLSLCCGGGSRVLFCCSLAAGSQDLRSLICFGEFSFLRPPLLGIELPVPFGARSQAPWLLCVSPYFILGIFYWFCVPSTFLSLYVRCDDDKHMD